MTLPSLWRATDPAHFIGPARQWASHLTKLVELAKPQRDPLCLAFFGPPGVGQALRDADFAVACRSGGH